MGQFVVETSFLKEESECGRRPKRGRVLTDVENMTTCQKSQRLWFPHGILQPRFPVVLRTRLLDALRAGTSVTGRMFSNPLWLLKIRITNPAEITTLPQYKKWIFAPLPVIFPALFRAG